MLNIWSTRQKNGDVKRGRHMKSTMREMALNIHGLIGKQ